LSLELVMRALVSSGLTQTDAEVYIFLAPKTPQKARYIAFALKMKKQQLYSCLKSLQDKGIVNCTGEHPTLFSAVAIEKVIDSLIKANLEEAQHMEENRKKILSSWRSMIKENTHHRE